MIYYLKDSVLHIEKEDKAMEALGLDREDLEYSCRDTSPELVAKTMQALRDKARRRVGKAIDDARAIQALMILSTSLIGELPKKTTDLAPPEDPSMFESDMDSLTARLSAVNRLASTDIMKARREEVTSMLTRLYEQGCKILPNGETKAMIARALLEELVVRMKDPRVDVDAMLTKFACYLGGVVKLPSLKSIRQLQARSNNKAYAKAVGRKGNDGGWETKRRIAKGKVQSKTVKVVYDGFSG